MHALLRGAFMCSITAHWQEMSWLLQDVEQCVSTVDPVTFGIGNLRSASDSTPMRRGVHSSTGGKGAGTNAEYAPKETVRPGMNDGLAMDQA